MSRTLSDARLVTPEGVHDGWLTIEDGRITHIGRGTAPGNGESLGGRTVVPGFIDIHNHGGAGGSYPSGDPQGARRAAAFHLSHGTTTSLASLVTASLDDLERAAAVLADLCEDGVFGGIHYEGPYIAKARCGAHDPALLREPSRAELARLVKAGRGHVRMVTIAAELPGALDVIRDATADGVIAAVGHSDADYDQTQAAIDAGATVATHLYNALPPLGHRAPGPIAALLQDERITVELINDGVHVHPAMLNMAMTVAGPARTTLITDAMAAAGMGDGTYPLGPLTVNVENGVARLADSGASSNAPGSGASSNAPGSGASSNAPGSGAIAGSTLTMDVAFRRTVQVVGRPLTEAALMASLTPARTLGLAAEIGSISVGKHADLVVLDDDLRVIRVMKRGSWT